MAISCTHNQGVQDSTGVTSKAITPSFTPSANKLQFLTVVSRTGITADPNQPTASGASITWVVEKSVVYDNTSSSRRRLTVFRGLVASPTSGDITVDFGGQTQTSILISLDEFTGMDTTGTNGSGAIVQSVSNFDASATVNTLTVTLAAFSDTNNATWGSFGSSNSDTLNVGSGFTSISEFGSSDLNIHALMEFKATNDTTVDMSATTNQELGGIGIEIKIAGGAVILSPSYKSLLGVGL